MFRLNRPGALLICVLLAAGWSVQVLPAQSGQLPPLIDRELFFGDPEISGSQLSPDGRFIAFIKPYQGVRNVYVKRLDEAFDAARPITADKRPVPAYLWSRDSRFILYVQDKGGDENFHLYAVDPAGQAEAATGVPAARDLTPLEGIRAFLYAVPRRTPGKILVGLNDRDPAYHDIYSIDLASGERELVLRNDQKIGQFELDLDGRPRLAVRQLPDGGTEILEISGEQFQPRYSCTYLESCNPVRFHKDGRRVYLETNKGEADLSRLVLLDVASGAEEVVESDPEGKVDFGSPLFSEKTEELIGTVYVGDRVRIYPREEQLKTDLERLRRQLPAGELGLQSSTQDMRWHLVSVARDVDPGSLYLYDRQSGKTELLYRSRPQLPSEHLASMKAIRYQARDGIEIPAYLTLPRGVQAENLPTVVFPHGGPWSRDTWGYDSYAQFLANRGYAVLQPNFRGSTGYGKRFLNAGNKEWGTGAMQHDITDGVRHLIEQGIADPKRIGIFGGSYGGYATLAGVTFTPDLYAAGVPYVAPSNLVTLIESFPAYWGPFIKVWHLRVGDPADSQARADLIARSPLFMSEQIRTPLLVVHGLNDPRVKKSESDQIVVALRDRGLPVEYLVAPDEGHGFRSPENRLALAVALEDFLAKHLGGRVQESVPDATAARLKSLTVDVASVKLPDQLLARFAETAPLPQRHPERIAPGKLSYRVQLQVSGQEIEGTVERELTEGELEGVPVWILQSNSRMPVGDGSDTYQIDRQSLLPIRRNATQGQATLELSFSEASIQGSLDLAGRQLPVDLELAAPVLGDGSALELFVTALPLQPGYQTTLRAFELAGQRVRLLNLVVGEEPVEMAGQQRALKVELSPLDGQPGGALYWVSADTPHRVLRAEVRLPAAQGGGLMTLELQNP